MKRLKLTLTDELYDAIARRSALAGLPPATFARALLTQALPGTPSASQEAPRVPVGGTASALGGVGGGVSKNGKSPAKGFQGEMFSTSGKKKSTPGVEKLNASREWARPYVETWVAKWGGAPNVGLLRMKLEPLELADGREVTITRWKNYVTGLNPRFFPKGNAFTSALLRFISAPKAYDDDEWFLSDQERMDLAGL